MFANEMNFKDLNKCHKLYGHYLFWERGNLLLKSNLDNLSLPSNLLHNHISTTMDLLQQDAIISHFTHENIYMHKYRLLQIYIHMHVLYKHIYASIYKRLRV